MSLASRGVVAAVRLAPRVPEGLVRAAATLAADLTWCVTGAGVRRLEANLARVRPDLDATALRAVSRAGMRNYLRYYAEAFTLPGLSHERLDARVTAPGLDQVTAEIAAGRSVVLALGHQGNWDLARRVGHPAHRTGDHRGRAAGAGGGVRRVPRPARPGSACTSCRWTPAPTSSGSSCAPRGPGVR